MSSENLKLNRQGCFRLYTATRLLIQVYQPWFAQLGITYTQYLVLMVLWEQDNLPLNAISRRLYLESNTLTPLIKRMETMKMVTRKKQRRCPSDHRCFDRTWTCTTTTGSYHPQLHD